MNKRLKELLSLKKEGKLTSEQEVELSKLLKMKPNRGGPRDNPDQKASKHYDYGPGNDFAWWNKYPELTKDVTNFKCNYVAGKPIAGTDIPFVVPGVLAILLESVYGCDSEATDPINVWARDTYLKMFQKYRPATGYSASDLGIAIIAGVEVLKLIATYERIYGVINRYNVLNVNMPDAEALALGISPAQAQVLRGRLSDFRYDLNALLMKAQRICVPKDLSVVADAIALFGYEYMDHESARSQFIFFKARHFGKYSDTNMQSGGSVEFATGVLFDFTKDNMCDFLNDCVSALIGSDSIQRIFADLVVWFGESAMMQFLPVPENYVVYPTYREEILHKLHNIEQFSIDTTEELHSAVSTALSATDITYLQLPTTQRTIYQVNDVIVTKFGSRRASGIITFVPDGAFTYAASDSGATLPSTSYGHILDTYRNEITPDIVMEGVLFKHTAHQLVNSGNYAKVADSAAFYVVTNAELISMSSGVPASTSLQLTRTISADNAAQVAGYFACIDWAPLVYYISSNKIQFVGGDVDNVIVLYADNIQKLQRAAVLSGLRTDQPIVGK